MAGGEATHVGIIRKTSQKGSGGQLGPAWKGQGVLGSRGQAGGGASLLEHHLHAIRSRDGQSQAGR
eukprot:8803552-Pyramimonas_sp.AAC.1